MDFLRNSVLPIRKRDGTVGSTFVVRPLVISGYGGPYIKEDCPSYKATLKQGRVSFTKVKLGNL